MSDTRLIRVVLGLLLVGMFLGISLYSNHYSQNIDRFYHFAISKMVATQGAPSTIEAVEHLGWHKQFAEKEYLFHQLTGLGYLFGQESGVRASVALVSSLLLISLFYFASRALGAPLAFLLISALTIFETYFVFRLILIRPHNLAVFLVITSLIVCLYAWRKVACLAAFLLGVLFALSYHAFYLPLGLFFMGVLAALLARDRSRQYTFLSAIMGVVIGILINPYYPSNVSIAIDHLLMAISPPVGIPGYFVGAELLKPRPIQVLSTFYPHLSLLLISLIGLCFSKWKSRNQDPDSPRSSHCELAAWYLVVASIFLWALGIKNPRAFEYAVPITIMAVAQSYSITAFSFKKSLLAVVLVACMIAKYPGAWSAINSETTPVAKRIRAGHIALASIAPEELAGKKVFNCHWDMGSLLLYHHPQARMIDLLDPRLLYFYDPKLAKLRLRLFEGRLSHPVEVITRIFKADYIFCASAGVFSQLETSPKLRRVYPKTARLLAPKYTPGLQPALYRVSDK